MSSSNDTPHINLQIPKPEKEECTPCVKLLREILSRAESRPRHLISSMMNTNELSWRTTADGVEVEIPAESTTDPMLLSRRWSRLVYNQEKEKSKEQDEPPLLLRRQSSLQATSAVKPPTEWLQMSCRQCATTGPEGGARAYVMGPTPLSIVVCQNRLSKGSRVDQQHEMEEILTHELVHVYDVRQLQLDLRDCENLAYSEVRAARQAECSTLVDTSWYPYQSWCIRQKSLTATHNLFPQTGRQCINRVFDKAMADTRPFEDTKTFNNSKNGTSSR